MEQDIQELFNKIKSGTSSTEEDEIMKNWLHQLNNDKAVDLTPLEIRLAKNNIWKGIVGELKIEQPKKRKLWPLISTAAAVIIVALVVVYENKGIFSTQNEQQLTYLQQDKDPGNTKAHVLLADGSVINIDQAHNESLLSKAGIKIEKKSDGSIVYKLVVKEQESKEFRYNKIYTPKGGQFNIELADGSKVMLNAYSSLSYPTFFKDEERSVELSGEAFFKIKKLEKNGTNIPFYVKTHTQRIEVLGTEFNVSAYDDDDFTATTLIEGKVSVNVLNSSNKKILYPGEQSYLLNDNNSLKINKGTVESAIAWTDGNFLFEDSYLKDILMHISRWYDIDISLRDIPKTRYNIFISRNNKLSTVLKMLEKTGDLKFRVINNTIEIIK